MKAQQAGVGTPGAARVCKPRVRAIPLQARVFAWSIVAATIAGFAYSTLDRPPFTGRSTLWLVLLTALTALAWRYPVPFSGNTRVYITSASTFAAVLLLPPAMAAASAALGIAACEAINRGRLIRQAFNTAALTLNVLVAAAVLALLSPHAFLEGPDLATAGVVALAAAAHYLVNALVVEAMGSLHQRQNLLHGWSDRHRRMLPHRIALYLLGVFAALVGHQEPLTLLLVAVPAWAVYRSLRDGVALRTQTREAVEQLADIVDMRDRYTFEHSRRVAVLSRQTAVRMGLTAAQAEEIYMAGRVHDVGKIGISSTTLFKDGKLNDEEWEEMRSHPGVGAQLIGKFPDFSAGMEIVRHHHERWDGKGYPDGLAGTQIPLGARVVAVADTFDAMTSSRAYRRALPMEHVYAELERCRGSQFDPRPLDAFLRLLRDQPDIVARTESVAGPRIEPPVTLETAGRASA